MLPEGFGQQFQERCSVRRKSIGSVAFHSVEQTVGRALLAMQQPISREAGNQSLYLRSAVRVDEVQSIHCHAHEIAPHA